LLGGAVALAGLFYFSGGVGLGISPTTPTTPTTLSPLEQNEFATKFNYI